MILPSGNPQPHLTVLDGPAKLGFVSVLNRGLDSCKFLESSHQNRLVHHATA
jgi:hypothetical protein